MLRYLKEHSAAIEMFPLFFIAVNVFSLYPLKNSIEDN